MERKRVSNRGKKIILFLFSILVIFLLFSGTIIKEVEKVSSDFIIANLEDYKSRKIGNMTFHFKEENGYNLEEVSNIAQEMIEKVNKNFGKEDAESFHVVIYPNSMEMNRGLRLPSGENTLGAYYGNNIFLLSPSQLSEANSPFKNVFLHEYTHLLVEEKTKGNHPVWFTEGVALYQEYMITDYEWGKGVVYNQFPYSLSQLEKEFYQLDTFQAYRSSFLRVRFLAEEYGEESILKIIEELGNGKTIQDAMESVLKKENNTIENEFRLWYQYNFYDKL